MSDLDKQWAGLEWSAQPAEDLAVGGFVDLRRRQLRNCYADGSLGQWYHLETVHPHFVDAVVLVIHHTPPGGALQVLLRLCLRPSLQTRRDSPLQLALDCGQAWPARLWELPAGGIEPEDVLPGGMGVEGRAQQEAWEETGLRVRRADLRRLGAPVFAAPAFCTERLHFFACPGEPAAAETPPGDGHPLEEGAELRWLALDQALAWCDQGRIMDSKTELGLRRFAAQQAGSASQAGSAHQARPDGGKP